MNILFEYNSNRLPDGYNIIGKWNGRSYTVVRLLGSGENGTVYLVKSSGVFYALKLSNSTYDLSYEVQAIKRLNETQGTSLGFSIFDIDDFVHNDKMFTYYVMPYQKGIMLKNYLYGKGLVDYIDTYKKVAKILSEIHHDGWVFGDLKSEHIIIDPDNLSISLIDYGGLTVIDEGVRQYTEMYDRGSWKAGTRKADSHYDLFSLTMIFIQLGVGEKKFLKIYNRSRSLNELYDIIQSANNLKYLKATFSEILKGNIKDADSVLEEIDQLQLFDKINRTFNWIDLLFASSLVLFFLLFARFIYS